MGSLGALGLISSNHNSSSGTDALTLGEVLKASFPSHSVHSFTLKTKEDAEGKACALHEVQALVQDQRSTGDVQTHNLLLKTYPINEGRIQLLDITGMFMREVYMYQYLQEIVDFQKKCGNGKSSIIPAFPKIYSTYYRSPDEAELVLKNNTSSSYDPYLIRGHLLMEDLRNPGGFKPPVGHQGVTLNETLVVFAEFAKCHALSYVHTKRTQIDGPQFFQRYPFLHEPYNTPQCKPPLNQIWEGALGATLDLINQKHGVNSMYSQRLRALSGSTLKICHHFFAGRNDMSLDEMIQAPDFTQVNLHDFEYERKARNNWLVVTHGDAHLFNSLFRRGNEGKILEVRLIDLQASRQTCLMADLIYFLFTSTSRDLRKKHLTDILKYYHDQFIKNCALVGEKPWSNFNVSTLMERYKNWSRYGGILAMVVIPIILSEVDLDKECTSCDASENMFDGALKNANVENMSRLIDVIEDLVDDGIF